MPGMSRSTAMALSLWKCPPKPLREASAATARPGRWRTGRRRRSPTSPPRRGAGPRRCGGRRGTGSRRSAADRPARRRGRVRGRLLVERGVEDPRGAEGLLQAERHAVHAALGADVLAEHDRLRARGEHVGQRGVDRLREGERPSPRAGHGGTTPCGPWRRRCGRPGCAGHRPPPPRPTPGVGRQHVVGGRPDAGARRFVPGQHGPARPARVHQRLGRAEQRVAREVGGHVALAAVAELGVGAGVAEEAHGPQVQHDRLAGRADPVGRLARGVQGGERVGAVGPQVPEAGPRGQRVLDPARRAGHRDAPPVVLAHHEQRHRIRVGTAWPAALSAPTAVEWLIDASPRLATTTASSGQGVATPIRGARCEREGEADRAGQVRRDRRGLGDDVQCRVAEDLVPASGDRSSRDAVSPSSTSLTGSTPDPARPGRSRSRPSGSAAARGRWAATPSRRPRCSRGRDPIV